VTTSRRFEAIVFDWDGTAVPDRDADASCARRLIEGLCAASVDVFVVSGTHVGNVDGQLRARPLGPGRLWLCLNRGSEVFEVDGDGPRLIHRRQATLEEDAALTAAAELVVARLAESGLRAEIVSQRLNRRKIDLIPEPEWADPPKARIDELLEAVSQRLRSSGIADLRAVVEIAKVASREAGLSSPRVTSDVKHVEIGLTDKSDSAERIYRDLWDRGIHPVDVLIGGDEFGPLGGMDGSDSLMLIPRLAGATAISVGVEPEGLCEGVIGIGGGPAAFLEILDDQLRRRRDGDVPHVTPLDGWTIGVHGFDPEHERAHEVTLSLSDGTMSTSGAPPAAHPDAAPHVFAAGFYRGTGRDSELAECPLWTLLGFRLTEDMHLDRTLDLRSGILHHRIETPDGAVEVDAFASLARPGTMVLRANGEHGLIAGGQILQGPEHGTSNGREWSSAAGADSEIRAAGSERSTVKGLDRLVSYARTGLTHALASVEAAEEAGHDALLAEHRARWASRWNDADVVIRGDPDLQRAVRFAIFHLIGQVSNEGESALGARGMTGSGYKGHVFWDAEVFALPFYAATHPRAARTMLEYRIRRLPAALEAARRRGRSGARFPWESAADGFDVTPSSGRDHAGRIVPIRTAENEEHIVADIAWAADTYVRWTGDDGFARGPGRRLWIETARYWASRIRRHDSRAHIFGVIGPDEYHEPVDDNAYTNVMARWNLRRAAEAAGDDIDPAERRGWQALADELIDGFDPVTRIYEQFSGFNDLEHLDLTEALTSRPVAADLVLGRDRVKHSQVIKQADVLMLHHLVPDEVAAGSLLPNLDHYEPRTAHGSSLSPGIHAALFARAGRPDDGLGLLKLAAHTDLDDVTRATAAGLHIATMGTVWQAIALGYAGLSPKGEVLHIEPNMPSSWDRLELNVRFRGAHVRIEIDRRDVRVSSDPTIRTEVHR
jgi:trehalose/maltose hydrolase-like predicted phosphorylase